MIAVLLKWPRSEIEKSSRFICSIEYREGPGYCSGDNGLLLFSLHLTALW